MVRRIYMDYAATTFVRPEVMDFMKPYFTEKFYNPSSLYSMSDDGKKAIARARDQVAKVINALPEEIYFTGGGSEADNWALKGSAFSKAGADKKHLITTSIEHHAITHSMEFLERQGFRVTYLPVNPDGMVRLEDLENAIEDDTLIVSIMAANNEIGTIQKLAEIGKLCHDRGVLFHTDAVQAAAHIPLDVKAMNIDMLSMAAHKFYGPKGVGALYIRKGLMIENLIHGGGQEKGRRAGTENVASIAGMGYAAELALSEMEEESKRLSILRDRLIEEITSRVPYTKLNGDQYSRLPNNVNFSFIGVEGETLLLDLDDAGISASTGSACASESLDPSHVLLAIGLPHEMAHGSVRLTMGHGTTEEDVDDLIRIIPEIIVRRREMSPLWEDFLKSQEV